MSTKLEVYLLIFDDVQIERASFDRTKIYKMADECNGGKGISGPYNAVSIEVEDQELLLDMQFENMDVLPIRVQEKPK